MSEAEFNRMCQVFKGFRSRGGASDEYLQESCTRQLGADGCRRCLTTN